jgi:hypothetical protein
VADCYEYGDEPSGSGATELVSYCQGLITIRRTVEKVSAFTLLILWCL